MSEENYKAIAKIIEDVVGKDTLTCIKLLEGIKFYIENQMEVMKFTDTNESKTIAFNIVNHNSSEANKAMKRYTARLKRDTEKLKATGEYCGVGE